MKLTGALKDLGHTIAYYPGLKKMTGSTTASILLCQMWYWTEVSGNEWVWKTREQIEKETGLTEQEQRTARDILTKMGILQTRYRRADHMNEFSINKEELDNRWEECKTREEFEKDRFSDTEKVYQRRTDVETKDVDQMIKDLYVNNETMDKLNLKTEIESKIKVRLRVNPSTEDWNRFIEYAANRQIKDKENIDVFINWVIADGFNPKFYPPMKMITMWPQAFAPVETVEREFVKAIPKKKEENISPMPKGIAKR